jgi:hypothetical protein
MKNTFKLLQIFAITCVFGVANANAQSLLNYSTYGDTDSVVVKESSLLPSAPSATVQSSSIISQSATATQFPTSIVVDPAVAASAKFWSAARIAALSTVAVAAVSVLANSAPTTQH